MGVVREAVGPHTRILAVVKADAYGHGALPVAWTALDAGCEMLGVGDSGEAIELREGGIARPILILGAIVEDEIHAVVQHDVAVTVHSTDLLPLLDAEAGRRGRRLGVHLKIDTGMTRLGLSVARAPEVARAILSCRNLRLDGLSTHFATASDAEATQAQLDRFGAARELLGRRSIRPPIVHAANSVGLFTRPDAHFDMVRPGIALYGLDPGPFAAMGLGLRSVLSLKTRIAYLKGVPEDTPVGYGGVHRTARATRVATCPVGYNDGYPYALSGRGEAVLRGRRVPLIGTVTMDYVMFDVGSIPEARIGDEVTLLGEGLRVEEIARRIGTIPYEITCGLGKRVKQVPVDGGQAMPAEFRIVA